MTKCLVFDTGDGKAYINPDLIAAVLDDPHDAAGSQIVCGDRAIWVPFSSKTVVEMIRNAVPGRTL
jgi:hypothetical protein